MKICFISKYPPIEGGISAKTYWIAHGLAEIGTEVHIITNSNCVEKEYLIDDNSSEVKTNLFIHYIDPEIPWHIPYSKLYISSLLDKTLEVIDKYKIDLIDTNYLIPYGIVGYLASKISGIPYIVRHGGSDLAKFLKQGIFSSLLENVIRDARAVITDSNNENLFKNTNGVIYKLPRYIPDERHFKPAYAVRKVPTFAYIGKINYYWKQKSLDKIVTLFSGIKQEHKLQFVGQGNGFNDFSDFVNQSGLGFYEFKRFIHPEKMPDLLNSIDFLIYFCQDSPIKDFSNVICEALWSGVTIITDKTMDFNEYLDYVELNPKNQIIRIDLNNAIAARKNICSLIENWNGPVRFQNTINYRFDKYIRDNLILFNECIS